MKQQFNKPFGTAKALEPKDEHKLFSEIGLGATFFDSIPSEILIVNQKGEIYAANESFCQTFDVESIDLLSRNWQELVTSEKNEIDEFLKKAFSQKSFSCEIKYKFDNHQDIGFHIDSTRLKNEPDYVALFHKKSSKSHSISDKKIASSITPKSENESFELQDEFFNRLVKFAQCPIFIADENYKLRLLNSGAYEFLGYESGELLGKDISTIICPTDRSRFEDLKNNLKENSPKEISGEWQYLRKDGSLVWGDSYSRFLPEGVFISFVNDITEKKQKVTKKLRESEEEYKAFVKNSSEGIWCFGLDEPFSTELPIEEQVQRIFDEARILKCNDAMAQMFGCKEAKDLINKHAYELLDRTNSVNVAYFRSFIESGYQIKDVEKHGKDANGNNTYFLNNLTGFIENGKFVKAWGTQRDITKLKENEERILQSEERYRVFIKQSSQEVARFEFNPPMPLNLSIEEQIRYIRENSYLAECNQAMAKHYGFENISDIIGKPFESFINSVEENSLLLSKFIHSDYLINDVESEEIDNDGSEKYYLNNLIGIIEKNKIVRMWGIQNNITQLKQAEKAHLVAEKQLRQAQKIEPIGRLAGGIAHDFNNFLAVIMLNVDMINMQLPEDDPMRFRINEIKSVTDNAAKMVKQLLAFGRKQTLQPHPIVLNQVIEEFSKVLGTLIGEHIEIELNLAEDLGVCYVDPNQITQVLMNLAVNSRDAMTDGGVLKIETDNLLIDENTFKHKAQPKGSYIQLSVSDNGVGMDNKTKKHVFEPFFTTKEAGKGTGLGLATVYGIIKQSKGFIWVDSKLGEGTTFKVHFPRIDKSAKTVKSEKVKAIPRGNETILLVEDEEQIRQAASEVLKVLGYDIIEAQNGDEALDIAKKSDKKIHLLLTDVVMPRMNGRKLAENMKNINPDISVLFMSGYTDDIISRHGVLDENLHFLGKPFSPISLATKVREALGTESKSTE